MSNPSKTIKYSTKRTMMTFAHKRKPGKISVPPLWVLVGVTALCLCSGCAPNPKPDILPGPFDPDASTMSEVYMAISGGGWRAHTAQSAWMMGLLDACRAKMKNPKDCNLETLLGNVKVISTNSGGSWFNTMLVYSKDFHDALTALRSVGTWGRLPSPTAPSGWLGHQRSLLGGAWNKYCEFKFDCLDCNRGCVTCGPGSCFSASCKSCNCLDEAFTGKINKVTGHPLIWMDTIRKIVFQPWGMAEKLDSIRLSDMDNRLPWAKGKTLLIAATMVTDKVILTRSDDDDYYRYTASASAAGVPPQSSVTPVSFFSVMPPFSAPDFFSAGDMSLTYDTNAWFTKPVSVTIKNADVNSNVFVLDAAAASSAAGGAEASVDVETYQKARAPWADAYVASDLAPAFLFNKMPIAFQPGSDLPTDLKSLVKYKVVRLADGGYLDNSAVAHVINFLQKNNGADDFNIVAFDNVQEQYLPPTSKTNPVPIPVPIDIAYLFGVGRSNNNEFCADVKDPNTCVKVPLATVFSESDLKSAKNVWLYEHGDRKLSYTRYSVTTVDNATLGVNKNTKGTLHVFASIDPSARTAPVAGDCDFDTYNDLVGFIHAGLTADGGFRANNLIQLLSEF